MMVDQIRPADAVKARDAGITTALVIRKDGVLAGQSVLVNLAGERAEDMVLRQPAALHLHLTTLTRQYPASLMGTMAYVRQSLLDAGRYRDEWAAYEKAPAGRKRPAYDKRLAALQDVAAGRETLVVTASRENDIRRALALADEFKLRLVVAGAPQASRVADLVKARKLPLLVSVNFDPPGSAPAGFGGFGGTDEDEQRSEIEDAKKNPAALEKAGVRFALVSGHAPDFLAGVRTAIASGLSKEAALRAVTLGAAEVLGIADRTGSLEAGKMANVVAWSGDPLTKEAKAKMVFVDGRLYEPEERTETKKEGSATEGEERR
jgi:imidazolonepropionase-like amidohydrolase